MIERLGAMSAVARAHRALGRKDGMLDRFATSAAIMMRTQVAMIGLISGGELLILGSHGVREIAVPKFLDSPSIDRRLIEICDLHVDERTRAHPLVDGRLGSHGYGCFARVDYAGQPFAEITTLDPEPRPPFSPETRLALFNLAEAVGHYMILETTMRDMLDISLSAVQSGKTS